MMHTGAYMMLTEECDRLTTRNTELEARADFAEEERDSLRKEGVGYFQENKQLRQQLAEAQRLLNIAENHKDQICASFSEVEQERNELRQRLGMKEE